MSYLLDLIFGSLLDDLAHRLGAAILRRLSGGRIKAESGYAWGWAGVIGGAIFIAPFVGFIAWLIYTRSL